MTTDVTDAEKCLLLARMAIVNNDTLRAEQLLLKSINIYPLDKAKELLKTLNNKYEANVHSNITGTIETAEECIDIAQNAFQQGNRPKAMRLLSKAERIYPTARAKDLMNQVKEKMIQNGEDPDKVQTEVKKNTDKKVDVPQAQPRKREVTSKQVHEIRRVKQATGDYNILGKFTNQFQIILIFIYNSRTLDYIPTCC